jgi:hypothetical protein
LVFQLFMTCMSPKVNHALRITLHLDLVS